MSTRSRYLLTLLLSLVATRGSPADYLGVAALVRHLSVDGVSYRRWEVFAFFGGPNDRVCGVRYFRPIGGWAAAQGAAAGFLHVDELSRSITSAPTSQAGSWLPQSSAQAVDGAALDSFVTIGDSVPMANGTVPSEAWSAVGGWNSPVMVAGRSMLGIGWELSVGSRAQGAATQGPEGFAVKLGQFVVEASSHMDAAFQFELGWNSDHAGVATWEVADFRICGQFVNYFRDADGDGYGVFERSVASCGLPPGFSPNGEDCDDHDAQVHPQVIWCRDLDGDGVGAGLDGLLIQCEPPAGYVRDSCGDNCREIANPTQEDLNHNAAGDACEIARGDLNLSGVVGVDDLVILMAAWGASSVAADLTGDGFVNGDDLALLLVNWGSTP